MQNANRVTWMAWCYAVTIFVSAFLVFQVQPIISKTILPWFGGSPAVWTTCMLFFQVVLFAGYVYAHLLTRLPTSIQGSLHLLLVMVSLWVLPLCPDTSWKPSSAQDPTVRILGLLLLNVGLPYFLLSATGPLIQAWFSRSCEGRSPYRLYALSNVGSLAALLTYPFLLEPVLTTNQQGRAWSVGFCVFVLFCGCCVMNVWRLRSASEAFSDGRHPEPVGNLASRDLQATSGMVPVWSQRAIWLGLPCLASIMLLATTNHVCQDVAVIPFLWVLPLSLYLLSFILTFDSDRWYSRRVCGWLVLLFIATSSVFSIIGYLPHVLAEIALSFGSLLLVCMICHGELVARKPCPRYLTQFYLMCSAGGALGGVIVAIVCPWLFSNYFEMNLMLLAGYVLGVSVLFVEQTTSFAPSRLPRWALGLAGFLGLLVVVHAQLEALPVGQLASTRNFYGVLSVLEHETSDPTERGRALVHGRIMHGFQYLQSPLDRQATKYYADHTGIGLTLRHFPREDSLRVGVVGLGVGTLAAYGKPGDYYRFYEINPAVHRLAEKYFTFLRDSQAECDVVLGDARLMLEREISQEFDVLVLDAFSGDAIPTHLLTCEAFGVYVRHLRSDGVVAAHISNRHVDLRVVFERLAQHYGLSTTEMLVQGAGGPGASGAHWIAATTNKQFLGNRAIRNALPKRERQVAKAPLWTDEYTNLLGILK